MLAAIFLAYFIARFFVNQNSVTQYHDEIENLRMVVQNLNLMKKVKLYGIETVVDNSRFKNYTLLSNVLSSHVSDLYAYQRSYDTYIYPAVENLALVLGNSQIAALIKDSLCLQDNIKLYLDTGSVYNLFPDESYNPS